ncbi:MAG: T9SS type A sorting domain-containing protein [Ignavibacteria bacterium]|nr:T9SS type A sorting domain-containing protein [Ignavibacteria bacterium]
MLGRYFVLLCLVGFLAFTSTSAQISFSVGQSDDLRTSAVVPKTARVVRPPAGLVDLLLQKGEHRITVPTAEGNVTLIAERFDLFTDDAVFIDRGRAGEEIVPLPHHALVRGRVEGRPGSTVFLAAFQTHIIAMVDFLEPEGKRRFLIAPDTIIPGTMATHVYYESLPGEGTPRDCHAETLPDYQQKVDSVFRIVNAMDAQRKISGDREQKATPYALQFALDCTHSFYKNLDSNLTSAASSAIAIAGAAAVVYQRDANVILRVPYLRVWTVTDPYPGEIGNKLGRIRDHWEANMKHVRRSVTCLLSGEGGGGLAWVGVLCGGYGYNVSGVDGRVNFPATGYVWDVDVTSHELGHNIGSSHTHNCGWNPPLDSCWNAEGGCYENTRVQRGTIMSYCHLQWKGTELQFHPRVASLFNRVLEGTNCAAPLPSARDTDVAVINIRVPANGATIVTRQGFAPSVDVRNLGLKSLVNVPVTFAVTGLDNVVKKSVTTNVARIDPNASVVVTFPTMAIDTAGDYLAVANIQAVSDQHATNDIMTRPFRVAAAENGSITITSPNGGETLIGGTTAKVLYKATNVARVLFEYSVDNGSTWKTLQYSVDGTLTELDWVVPFVPSTQCLIRASSLKNASTVDLSNAVFAISVPLDVQAYDIAAPVTNSSSATPVAPRVVVRNNGSTDAVDVKCTVAIRWIRSAVPSVDTTFVVPRVRAGAQDTLTLLPTPILASGVHVVTFTVDAAGDENDANDRFGREFTSVGISPPSDIRYEEGPGRVLLQWMNRDNNAADRIELWRGSSVEDLRRIRTFRPSVTSFVDDGLVNDTTYIYALRTVNGAKLSVYSPYLTTRPTIFPAGTKLSAPVLISPTDGLSGVPVPTDLVWSTVKGGDQYEIQIAEDASYQNLLYVHIVRDPGAIVLPLEYNTTYRWRVRALNQTYTGPWSTKATYVTTRTCAGAALSFNGTDSKATDASFTWNGGPVTVEYWTFVKSSERKTSSTFMVGAGDNGANRFQAHAPWEDGVVYWDYGSVSDKGRISTTFGPYFDRWVHVAMVSDGTSFKAIYFNGQLAASANEAGQPTGLTELTIGAMRTNLFFKGLVDEFRIWSVARTADEIRSSMFRRLPQPSENSKIAGCWRFDEGSGTTAKDAVRNRQLTLTPSTEWTASGATVNCEDVAPLTTPTFLSGVGSVPRPRDHRYEISWSEITTTRGNVWYDLEVTDPRGSSIVASANNVTSSSPTHTAHVVGELPADSTMTVRVRAHSTYSQSAWAEVPITTLPPCETKAVQFSGKGERFTSADFLYAGKAVTVEYWSLVNADQLMRSVAFMAGEKDDETKRFQAHAPWDDKTYYWDYGNWREAGRVSASYEGSLSSWTHVALVSNGYDTMAIYLNGNLAKKSSFSDAPGTLKQLTIGGNPFSRNYHKGWMRDLRIWNVMRSERQIRSGMYERISEPRSNLLGSWLLDEGRGLQTTDVTGRTANAVSTTEITWDDVTSKLMQAPAVVSGRRDVQRGDTASYRARATSDVTYKWTVAGGTISSSDVTNELAVTWTGADSIGVITLARTWPGGCSDVTTTTVNLYTTLDVASEDNTSANISVHPNPATDNCSIVWNGSEEARRLDVVDAQGRVVHTSDVLSAAVMVNTQLFASGTYLVRITTDRTVYVQRFVVQR